VDVNLPVATVTVIRLADDAIRVHVMCPFVTTGVGSLPGRYASHEREQILTMTALRQHVAGCGRCDAEGCVPDFKRWTDWTWDEFITATRRDRTGDVRK
jgi:hypothetical protein